MRYKFIKIDKFRTLATDLNIIDFSNQILKTNRYNYYNWLNSHFIIKNMDAGYGLLRVLKTPAPNNFTVTNQYNEINLKLFRSKIDGDRYAFKAMQSIYDLSDNTMNKYIKGSYLITPCYSLCKILFKFNDDSIEDVFKYYNTKEYAEVVDYKKLVMNSLGLDM